MADPAPTILLVDDEDAVRKVLAFPLERDGYEVIQAADGEEALQQFAQQPVDLVVLDIMLPRLDGLEVCKRLRATSTVPIIMLTARDDELDKVIGLELGADDYITKPFSPRELLARIRTVLRRTKSVALTEARHQERRAYRFADFELNLRTRRLKRGDGRSIELTNGEFNLLAALLAAPQRILTRDQMLEASRVYDNEVYDRSIDVQVLRLRRKIEENPSQPRYILTERGVGYLFNSTVEVLY